MKLLSYLNYLVGVIFSSLLLDISVRIIIVADVIVLISILIVSFNFGLFNQLQEHGVECHKGNVLLIFLRDKFFGFNKDRLDILDSGKPYIANWCDRIWCSELKFGHSSKPDQCVDTQSKNIGIDYWTDCEREFVRDSVFLFVFIEKVDLLWLCQLSVLGLGLIKIV